MNKRIKIALVFIILCTVGAAIYLIIKLHVKNEYSKDVKERIQQCEEEVNDKKLIPLEVDYSNDVRRLDEEAEFKPFKIYLDLTFIKYQASLDENLKKHIDQVIKSMEKAKNTLESLFLVKPFVTRWVVRAENLQNLGIEKFNENFFKKKDEESQNLVQIGYDLYIFPNFGELNSMGSWGIYYKDTNKRPIVTKMTLSTKFNFDKNGSAKYLDVLFLHYFTHLLGFSGTYIKENFPENPYLIKKDKFGVERHYITSKKVIETAKKYFNCNNIEAVELDNKGIINGVSTHWEPRILLGDYMSSFGIEYEEHAISEITLSLMEDSGWYKANYFTGGLMRFGKNKGCDFLNEKCVDQTTHKTNFANEFFDELYINKVTPSCSSGRQSRNYKIYYQYSATIPPEFQYFGKDNIGGSSSYADYCPIMDSLKSETENDYYVGNCKNGADMYGYNTRYKKFNENKYIYGIKNTQLPQEFGESLNKDNSFCVINSLVLKSNSLNYKYNYTAPRAMCHEMMCSDRTLTIKINNDYIICPRQGGKVEIDGYDGFILCPDYNLICTGSTMCNDLFDCVDKKSLVKSSSFAYDYEINTSQDYGKEETKAPIIAYEESSNGFCPINCGRCNEKKECLKQKNLCTSIDPNCESCVLNNGNKICSKCKNNLFLYENKCYEVKKSLIVNNREKKCDILIDGCSSCITNTICTECYSGYGLDGYTKRCIDLSTIKKGYYYDPKAQAVKKCDQGVANCNYCTSSDFCYRCKTGYFLIESDNNVWDHSTCFSKNDIPNINEFYNKNNTHRALCSTKISNCETCNTLGSLCKRCFEGYKLQNNKHNCTLKSTNNKCRQKFPHCITCDEKLNNCIKCDAGYTPKKYERLGKCFPIPVESEHMYYNDTQTGLFKKCLDSPYLEMCHRCTDAYTCIECDSKIHVLIDGKCIRTSN